MKVIVVSSSENSGAISTPPRPARIMVRIHATAELAPR